MRLDLFLKASRLVNRRSVARQLCDAGKVSVNGHTAKASKEVSARDMINLDRGRRHTAVRILSLPDAKQVSRSAAHDLIEIVEETIDADDLY